jgi:hypothetical protein
VEEPVDQLLKDAQRLVSIGTFFIVAGWVFVIYAIGAIGLPIFFAFIIAGFGYFLRLFALYVATRGE